MRWQLGQFFGFVGLLVLMVFLITGWAGSPVYTYFCSGVLAVVFGAYLMWLGRNPPQPAERFRLFHGMRKRREDRRQARKKRDGSDQKG
ncbi:MAG TPA: hypothetical protein VLA49_17515 [Anaerolineales bacterium]|nr:hypothetical protein [Anaerolineales bacterium]